MSEIDTALLSTSKMELAVTKIDGSPYIPSLQYWPGDSWIYHLLPTL